MGVMIGAPEKIQVYIGARKVVNIRVPRLKQHQCVVAVGNGLAMDNNAQALRLGSECDFVIRSIRH